MFTALLASERRSNHSSQSALLALAVHAVLILIAVRVTAHALFVPMVVARDTILLGISDMPAADAAPDIGSIPSSPSQLPAAPLTLALPSVLLPQIAFPSLETRKLDPIALRSVASPNDSGVRPIGQANPSNRTAAASDTPPILQRAMEPRYPEELSRSGMSGVVDLEYEVRADGRVNPVSIRVIWSTHPAFARSAREAIQGARFRPARRLGRPVPVMVRQRIRFQNR
jgi:periplasmic protein TonB